MSKYFVRDRQGNIIGWCSFPSADSDQSPVDENSPEWIAFVSSDEAAAARARRDDLLRASDWVTLRAFDTGAPVPQAWLDYRAALRDVPQQAGFPANIIWPTKPQD